MTEQQPYDVVAEVDGFELRRYPEHRVVETGVRGSFEGAGNRAFRPLVGYISGANASRQRFAMTAPVLQEAGADDGDYRVAFVLPESAASADAPPPTDPTLTVRAVAPEWALVSRYSGRWSRSAFDRHVAQLREAAAAHGLRETGPPRWARFDPPWTPWFLRHNEALLPVAEPSGGGVGTGPGGSLES